MSDYIEDRIWVMWGKGLSPAAIAARLNADLVYDDGKPHWDADIVEQTVIWLLWQTGKLDTIDIRDDLARHPSRPRRETMANIAQWHFHQSEAAVEQQVHRSAAHEERLALAQAALKRAEARAGVRRRDAAGAGRSRPNEHAGA